MPVRCGWCGEMVRRREDHQAFADYPTIHTRTLVKGVMVPSCSPPCADQLRQRAWKEKAKDPQGGLTCLY